MCIWCVCSLAHPCARACKHTACECKRMPLCTCLCIRACLRVGVPACARLFVCMSVDRRTDEHDRLGLHRSTSVTQMDGHTHTVTTPTMPCHINLRGRNEPFGKYPNRGNRPKLSCFHTRLRIQALLTFIHFDGAFAYGTNQQTYVDH